jgi:general secretion pathway protein C
VVADRALRRYYPLAICALLGGAAYFQAVGMGELVSAQLALGPTATPGKGATRTTVVAPIEGKARSGQPILARNPFDSVTGPLDGKPDAPTEPSDAAGGSAGSDNLNPLLDPACESGRVELITFSDDPSWSFASLSASDGKTQLRRVGDTFGSHTVYFVGWDRVWLQSGSQRCQLRMFDKKADKPGTERKKPEDDKGKKRGSKVQDDIASKIQKVSDHEFNVDRTVIGQIIENQAELMRTARVQPDKDGGVKISGIKSGSLLNEIGMKNNDKLMSVNGVDVSDPQKVLEVYAKLPQLSRVTITIKRDGKPQNLDFNIK